jgi:PAS domain S-box-containing protein
MMDDTMKTKAQLVRELVEARARLTEMEMVAAKREPQQPTLIQEHYLLQSFLDNVPDHIYFKDTASRFIKINHAMAHWFGLTDPAQAIGKTDFDFFAADHAQPAYSDEQEVIRTGQPIAKEEKEVWPDGHETWVLTTKLPLRDQADHIIGTFGISKDITARKQAEETARISKEFLENVLDALDDPIFVKDEQHRWVIVNEACAGDLPKAELIGKSDYDFTPKELADVYWTTDTLVLETGETNVNEEVVIHRGQPRTVLTKKSRFIDPVTGQKYIVGSIRDITERKHDEETLKQAYEEVEKQVAERTAELRHETAERERLQHEVITAQQEAIQELSTPVIPVMEQIIIMPLVGSIDSLRARDLTRALLAGITQHQAKVVILDITGVPIVDSGVAGHLHKTIQAAQLKGARVIITGIAEAVAEAIVDLGIDWHHLETLADLQTGLVVALRGLGITLNKG